MAFSKITSAELLNKGVTGLDDTPALSVADMQAKFDELPNLAITKHNALVDDLNLKLPNLEGIATIIESSDVKIPTSKAIVDYVVTMGGGDMTKAVYDTDDSGVVDNAEKLGGELPSYYQKSTDNTLDTTDKTITGAINELNTKMANALSGTLAIGQTSLTISDASITTSSLIDVYTDVFGVNPTAISVSTGEITLTFLAQTVTVNVKVRCS